jgi:hypothetical protein
VFRVSGLGVGGRWPVAGGVVSWVFTGHQRVVARPSLSRTWGPSGALFRYRLACKDQPGGLTRWVGSTLALVRWGRAERKCPGEPAEPGSAEPNRRSRSRVETLLSHSLNRDPYPDHRHVQPTPGLGW